jgi:hypothetical protein
MIAPSSRHALLLARAIGRYETIADSGVLAEANMEARQCIELMDLAAAELDKQLSPP